MAAPPVMKGRVMVLCLEKIRGTRENMVQQVLEAWARCKFKAIKLNKSKVKADLYSSLTKPKT